MATAAGAAAPAATETDSTIFVHPLVILNMADHHLRASFQSSASSSSSSSAAAASRKACGLLFGVQTGLRVEVFASFEMRVVPAAGAGAAAAASNSAPPSSSALVIDEKFVTSQKELVSKVFPAYELLGWYAAAPTGEIDEEVLALQAQMAVFNESPLCMVLRTSGVRPDDRQLPLAIYRSDVKGGAVMLSPVSYTIETTESERVTVDFMTNTVGAAAMAAAAASVGATAASSSSSSSSGGAAASSSSSSSSSASTAAASATAAAVEAESSYISHLRTQASALGMLSERLGVLQRYLQAVEGGAVPPSRALLRQISAVAASVPVADSARFDAELAKDLDDGMLMTFLASVTTGVDAIHELVHKLPPEAPPADKDERGFGGFGGGGGGGGGGMFGAGGDRRRRAGPAMPSHM